jgi:hypothetical protein
LGLVSSAFAGQNISTAVRELIKEKPASLVYVVVGTGALGILIDYFMIVGEEKTQRKLVPKKPAPKKEIKPVVKKESEGEWQSLANVYVLYMKTNDVVPREPKVEDKKFKNITTSLPQKRDGEDKVSDLVARINARDTTRLPVAEVVLRWRFVSGVFHAKVLSKTANCLIAGVPLRDRFRQAGPGDGCCCLDMRLPLIGSKGCKAAQEIFSVAESETGGTPHGKVRFDSRNHPFTSGHG